MVHVTASSRHGPQTNQKETKLCNNFCIFAPPTPARTEALSEEFGMQTTEVYMMGQEEGDEHTETGSAPPGAWHGTK